MGKTLTVRLDDERIAALDQVAETVDRDRSYIVTQAIDAYLETQAWQLAYIEEAVRQAEAGKFATKGQVAETFQRLLRTGKRKAG